MKPLQRLLVLVPCHVTQVLVAMNLGVMLVSLAPTCSSLLVHRILELSIVLSNSQRREEGREGSGCVATEKKNTHSEPAIGQHGRWLTGIEDGRETSDTWTGDQGNWSCDGDCTGVTLARVSGSTKVEESNHLVIPWKKIVFGDNRCTSRWSFKYTHSLYTYMDLSYLMYKYMSTHKLTATLMLKHENNKNFFLFSVSQTPVDSSHQLFLLTRGSKYSLLGLQQRLRYI